MKILFLVLILMGVSAEASLFIKKDLTNWPPAPNVVVQGWMGACPQGQTCYELIGLCRPWLASIDDTAKTLTCPPQLKRKGK